MSRWCYYQPQRKRVKITPAWTILLCFISLTESLGPRKYFSKMRNLTFSAVWEPLQKTAPMGLLELFPIPRETDGGGFHTVWLIEVHWDLSTLQKRFYLNQKAFFKCLGWSLQITDRLSLTSGNKTSFWRIIRSQVRMSFTSKYSRILSIIQGNNYIPHKFTACYSREKLLVIRYFKAVFLIVTLLYFLIFIPLETNLRFTWILRKEYYKP